MSTASGAEGPSAVRVLTVIVARWVVAPIATIVVASFLIFLALSAAPGDPITQILGGRATPEQREELRKALGLDDPLLVRYANWLTDALHGDFGLSFVFRQDVSTVLAPRVGVTVVLVVMAAVLILALGLTIGIFAGVSRRFRPLASALVGIGIAIPGFVAAVTLVAVFAVGLGWFPTFGAGVPGWDRVWHLTLPAIALCLGWAAYVAQITTASVREEAEADRVVTATARGLPRSVILRKHILRNALIPVLTASGLTVAGLVAGSVVIESAFAIDGIGSLLVKSVSSKDYAVVSAISLIIVIVFVVITTAIDITQTLLDPRDSSEGDAR